MIFALTSRQTDAAWRCSSRFLDVWVGYQNPADDINVGSRNIYNRLADIPGVGYQGHPGVDRQSLPNHDLRPRMSTSTYGGKQETYASWDMPNGVITSQSPAAAWASSGSPDASWSDRVTRLYETLELPGSGSDYHLAINSTVDALWDSRRQDPDVLPVLERLCLLDIKLIEAHPEIGQYANGENSFSLYAPAFGHLIRLYEREGYVKEALKVAQLGVALGQRPVDAERLEMRLRELEAEDAA
jgi:hypothetical protein